MAADREFIALDGLRGIAALAVVAGHAALMFGGGGRTAMRWQSTSSLY